MDFFINKEIDTIQRRVETGKFLNKARKKLGTTLSECGSILGVTKNYISEIERGLKTPSDELITKIAIMYGIDEYDLFKRYGKIPFVVRNQLEKFDMLYSLIVKVGNADFLTDIQRQELYFSMNELFESLK